MNRLIFLRLPALPWSSPELPSWGRARSREDPCFVDAVDSGGDDFRVVWRRVSEIRGAEAARRVALPDPERTTRGRRGPVPYLIRLLCCRHQAGGAIGTVSDGFAGECLDAHLVARFLQRTDYAR